MYKFELFNLGRFTLTVNVSEIILTPGGHDFKIASLDCSFNGEILNTVESEMQEFINWLGIKGLELQQATRDELEQQEHAMRDYYMPLDEAANY